MILFSIEAYSSIWFWALLTVVWLAVIDKFSVHSHSKWVGGFNSELSQQREILRFFYLKVDYLYEYKNFNLTFLVICFSSFFVVNWFILAFYYSVEFLQAAFLLFCPFLVSIILRLCLRQSIGNFGEASFQDVFAKVKLFRRISLFISSIALFSSIMWGSYFNLKTSFL
tara:strand:+ start:835 stop:1341 length:507 start_codon:yes stop_codon:yes gene_type:complete